MNYRTKIININGVPTEVVEVPNQMGMPMNQPPVNQFYPQAVNFAREPQRVAFQNLPQNYGISNPQFIPNQYFNSNGALNQPMTSIESDSARKKFDYSFTQFDEYIASLPKEMQDKYETLKYLLGRGDISLDEYLMKVRKICMDDMDA